MEHNYAIGVHRIKQSAKLKLIIFKNIMKTKAVLMLARVKQIEHHLKTYVKDTDMIFQCALTTEIEAPKSNNATGDQEMLKYVKT